MVVRSSEGAHLSERGDGCSVGGWFSCCTGLLMSSPPGKISCKEATTFQPFLCCSPRHGRTYLRYPTYWVKKLAQIKQTLLTDELSSLKVSVVAGHSVISCKTEMPVSKNMKEQSKKTPFPVPLPNERPGCIHFVSLQLTLNRCRSVIFIYICMTEHKQNWVLFITQKIRTDMSAS